MWVNSSRSVFSERWNNKYVLWSAGNKLLCYCILFSDSAASLWSGPSAPFPVECSSNRSITTCHCSQLSSSNSGARVQQSSLREQDGHAERLTDQQLYLPLRALHSGRWRLRLTSTRAKQQLAAITSLRLMCWESSLWAFHIQRIETADIRLLRNDVGPYMSRR